MSNDQSANAKPPLGTATLLQKCKQIRVHDVESAVGLALLNDAGNVDLAGTLRNHLDVDALLSKSAEEAATDADHAAKLAAHQGDDGHVGDEIDVAPDAKVVDGTLECFILAKAMLSSFFLRRPCYVIPGESEGDPAGWRRLVAE